ncbi:unnamed protein product, partial [Rotaria sordida]
ADFRQSFFDDNNSDDIDILLFWQERQQLFPILSKIAKVICAVPVANTIIERLFSAAKNNMQTLKQLSNNDFCRKRTVSMSSTTTVSSEESTCTVAKKSRINIEDSFSDLYNKDIFLD